MTTLADKAPADVCRLAGGPVQFAEGGERTAKSVPIKMVARSIEPVDHFWWGRIVHDLKGMKLHKATLPCDYCHDEPIGYLDRFKVTPEGLVVEGALVPTDSPEDRVKKLAQLSDGGVPFEASIYFGEEMKAEVIGENQVAEVNGYTFEGPGVIVREWFLRGVAVCPYGYDMNTSSAFRADVGKEFSIHPYQETAMKTAPTKPATQLNAAVAEPAAAPAANGEVAGAATATASTETTTTSAAAEDPEPAKTDPPAGELTPERKEAARFRTAFGDQGAVWFADGLSWEQAQARHAQALSARHEANEKALGDRITALEARLTAGGKVTGEANAAGFTAADGKKFGGFASKIRFAGSPAPVQ